MNHEYDLVIIGAGSGGLTGAGFAARLGSRVALIERSRIGGDCTWTGCIPSKALLRAARVAHEARTSARFGISCTPPVADMSKVRDFVRNTIQEVYRFETPDELRKQGVDLMLGPARFLDGRKIAVGEETVCAKRFLIATGARAVIPAISGLESVPFVTYEQIFDNDRLPPRMIVVGGGPVGAEMAQAYQRLGSQVTIIAHALLPRDEPEARERLERVFEREGIPLAQSRAKAARMDGTEIVITTDNQEVRGDLLLIATGRQANVLGLDPEKAGVRYSEKGIPVDDQLRTNVPYLRSGRRAGWSPVHFAGWQAFQAVRNALLPGHSSGFTDAVPWVTFTDPEVAHVGLTEERASAQLWDSV